MENYLFEHGSNPSLRKAIEQPNSKATNRRASQPTNPLFNVATIINHLGYLYFCISLWDSRHIQAIGAKFSSLSIYIRDDGSITRLARLVFILYPGWHPARHPFSPSGPRAPGFSRISSGNAAADNTTAPRPRARCRVPANLHFRARFRPVPPLRSARTSGIAPVTRTCVAQQDSSSSESESRWNVVSNFSRFNFFFFSF